MAGTLRGALPNQSCLALRTSSSGSGRSGQKSRMGQRGESANGTVRRKRCEWIVRTMGRCEERTRAKALWDGANDYKAKVKLQSSEDLLRQEGSLLDNVSERCGKKEGLLGLRKDGWTRHLAWRVRLLSQAQERCEDLYQSYRTALINLDRWLS